MEVIEIENHPVVAEVVAPAKRGRKVSPKGQLLAYLRADPVARLAALGEYCAGAQIAIVAAGQNPLGRKLTVAGQIKHCVGQLTPEQVKAACEHLGA